MTFDNLPVRPPVAPMLARLVRELPIGHYQYEPKWDGFRAIAIRAGDDVEIQSRHGRPFARYFPDLAAAFRRLPPRNVAVDGEIVIVRDGRFDFEQLMLRTHPAASRVAKLSDAAPATFIGFDLLADGDEDVMPAPFTECRRRLEGLIASTDDSAIWLTPATGDPRVAEEWLRRYHHGGADGVMATDRRTAYEPGRRAMLKVKLERTADCVVAGFRALADRQVASLLMGLYDEAGVLRHVGVVAAFTAARRRELFETLRPRVVGHRGHPWEAGFGIERSPLGRLKGSAAAGIPGFRWTGRLSSRSSSRSPTTLLTLAASATPPSFGAGDPTGRRRRAPSIRSPTRRVMVLRSPAAISQVDGAAPAERASRRPGICPRLAASQPRISASQVEAKEQPGMPPGRPRAPRK